MPFSLALIAALASATPTSPPISLPDAISRAERHLGQENIEIRHLYLDSANWEHSREQPHAGCWYLVWDVYASPPVMDAHVDVLVCSDGRITHYDDWA